MTPEELACIIFEIGQLITFEYDAVEGAIIWEQMPDEAKAFKIRVAGELLNRYVLVPVDKFNNVMLR